MNHRRLIGSIVLAFVVLVSGCVYAQTHGLPSTQLELQAVIGDLLQPGILPQTCTPAVPVSSLTIAAFTCQGYVKGTAGDNVYVNQTPAIAVTLPNSAGTYWLLLHRDTSSAVSGWTRVAGSHYLFQQATNQPLTPANGIIFAQVPVTSVITGITLMNVGKGTARALGLTIVSEFASGGDGSAANPWTGWDTNIDWTQSNKFYYAPCGTYNFANGITFTGGHVTFWGGGLACTIFQYTGTTGIAFYINTGSLTASSNEFDFGYFYMIPTTSSGSKNAIRAIDLRESHIHDIWIAQWYGLGTSSGLRIYGRDTSVFERLIIDADRPIVISPNTHTGVNVLDVGCDTCSFRDLNIGQLFSGVPSANPCFEVEDFTSFSRINIEGVESYNLCKHGFYWNAPNAIITSAGYVNLRNISWEQSTDPTGYLIFINYGPGGASAIRVQGLEIDHAYGGSAGQGIYLRGMQEGATIKNSWWTGFGTNPNSSGVGLKVDAQAGVGPSTYLSGGTVTGTVGQFCNVITFNTCTNAGGSIYLTGTNVIAANSVMYANNPATATCTKNPTTGVLTAAVFNGVTPTAAACSGTITIQGTTLNDGSFKSLTLIDNFLDGDPSFNTGGLDPCTGAAGAATGTHACILGLSKLQSWNVPVGGDIGKSAVYGANLGTNQTSLTLMGQTIQFPTAGLSPVTTASASGSLANNGSISPFPSVLDCPTGLNPCSGTFKAARMRITILSDDPACAANCVREAADLYINPPGWSDIASQAGDVSCLSCSPNIAVNTGGTGKFIIFHGTQLPPNGFFGFTNLVGVTVRWSAIVEVAY